MGLAADFFWNLTPLLWQMLVEQYSKRERRANLRAGVIAAELRNANRTKKTDKFWLASDFFDDTASKKEAQSESEMLVAMDAWVARTKGLHRC